VGIGSVRACALFYAAQPVDHMTAYKVAQIASFPAASIQLMLLPHR
jgi:hypothetical protein